MVIRGSSVDLSKCLSLQPLSFLDIHVSEPLAVLEFFLIVSHVVFRAVVRGAKLAFISENLQLEPMVTTDLVNEDRDDSEDQERPSGDHSHDQADLIGSFEGLWRSTCVCFIREHLRESVHRTGVRLFTMEGATAEDLTSRCHGSEKCSKGKQV